MPNSIAPPVSPLVRASLWLCFVAVAVLGLNSCGKSPDPGRQAPAASSQVPKGPMLVVAGIQESATPGTDCALPAESQTVDIFGVPKDDTIEVRIRFPEVWEGTPKTFGVEAERSDIARSSQTAIGDHKKVMLTIATGDLVTSSFFLRGSTVDKTRLVLDPVVDDRGTLDKTSDDLHYDEHFVPIIVWDFSVDDIVDYNALGDSEKRCYQDGEASPALQADPGVRTSCGAKATSIAADGVSHQLLRLRSGGYGRACFTIIDKQEFPDRSAEQYYGSMSDPLAGNPGQAPATNVETSFEFQKPDNPALLHWALGTYTPPTDFYDGAETERKVKIEVQFMPLDKNGLPVRSHITAKNKELEITIKRPPVLLVHGLWSSPNTWGDGFRNPKPDGGWHVDDSFSYPGAAPFSTQVSAEEMRVGIEDLIRKLRENSQMAVSKVDIVGHSMGGLKARRWLHDEGYRAPPTFHEGNVRKLVTLTTPHLGSPLANMLINLHDEFARPGEGQNHESDRLRILETFVGDLHGGAVCELADNNRAIGFGPYSGVRSLAYTASSGPPNDWALLIGLGLNIALCDTINVIKCALGPDLKAEQADPYLFRAPNDKIVDVESQSAGPPVARNFSYYSHLTLPLTPDGVTSEDDVAEAIYAKLDTDSSGIDGWSRNLPPVGIASQGVAPRRGGRGPEIDAQNYVNQCTPGSQMFPQIDRDYLHDKKRTR